MTWVARTVAAVRAWLAGAPGWVGGALAGLQAALLSLAVILVPAWAAVAAAPPTAESPSPDWGAASVAAARLWLLGFGVPADVGGVEVSLAPLGVPALAALMMIALARRFADKSWTSWLCAVAAFAATVGFVATLAWAGGDDTRKNMLTATAVAVVIAAPSAALGIWRAHGATLAWLGSLPHALRTGLRLGAASIGAHVALAAAVGAAWTIVGRHEIAEIATTLDTDAVSGVALAAVETLFTPTLVVWFMAWQVGAGFSVGLAHFSPGQIVEAPLPQVPLLGALPSAAGGVLSWMPLVVVVVIAAVRLAMRGRMPRGLDRLWASVLAVAIAGGTAFALGHAASGAMGPGTLESTGVEPGAFAGLTLALTAAGIAVGEGVDRVLVLTGYGATPGPARASRKPTPAPARGDHAASESKDPVREEKPRATWDE